MKCKYIIAFLLINSPLLAQKPHLNSSKSINNLKLNENIYQYNCPKNKNILIHYVTTGSEHSNKPVFVVLDLNHKSYGLSESVSASGSRYIGHYGTDLSHGLIWWEKGDNGTLYSFQGDNVDKSQILLKDCHINLAKQ